MGSGRRSRAAPRATRRGFLQGTVGIGSLVGTGVGGAVGTADGSRTAETAGNAPFVAVTIGWTNSSVEEGDHLLAGVEAMISGEETVTQRIEFEAGGPGPLHRLQNTGNLSETQTISVAVEPLGSTSEDVSLDGGQSTTLSVSFPTESGDAGSHTVTVTSGDDASRLVDVLHPTPFVVDIVDYGAKALPWIAMKYKAAGQMGDRRDELPFDQALWTETPCPTPADPLRMVRFESAYTVATVLPLYLKTICHRSGPAGILIVLV